MKTSTPEAALAELIELCKVRIETAKATPIESDKFLLVSPKGTMVVFRKDDGLFMLTASRADTGHPWPSFNAAKRAANRWNATLTAEQKAASCQVHACSHAQYLEYVVTNGERLLATMQARATQ